MFTFIDLFCNDISRLFPENCFENAFKTLFNTPDNHSSFFHREKRVLCSVNENSMIRRPRQGEPVSCIVLSRMVEKNDL